MTTIVDDHAAIGRELVVRKAFTCFRYLIGVNTEGIAEIARGLRISGVTVLCNDVARHRNLANWAVWLLSGSLHWPEKVILMPTPFAFVRVQRHYRPFAKASARVD